MISDEDLDLLPYERLKDALFRRVDHGVIVLLRVVDTDTRMFWRNYKGCQHTAMGLALDAAWVIREGLRQEEHEARET